MRFSKIILYFFFLLYTAICFSQQLPPIIQYSKDTYQAGIQNWMITQDNNRSMYFANNEGLLEFNGSKWILNPSPNETIIRSVNFINGKLYTGAFMEFGYWESASNGNLFYTSLSKSIEDKIAEDEQFWGIFQYDHWILFQSLSKIYAYNTKNKSFRIINPNTAILKAFKTTQGIYFQTAEGLFEIDKGKSKLFLSHPIINKDKIINIFDTKEGLLLVTQKKGVYSFSNNTLSKFQTNVDAEIEQSNIYSSQVLSDGSLVLGSISHGIFILSKEGQLLYQINQNSGLLNNTVLSLFEDVDKNLWIGLDNGINCLNLNSPIKSYSDNTGLLGTIYTSITFNKKLYIGTNQGLFCKDIFPNSKFEFVLNTKGQVWSLFSHQNTLFCGHDSGTFIVEDNSAKQIFNASGTWNFVPHSNTILLQGNYNGISVLEKNGNTWKFKNKIKNFNYSSKHFEILHSNEVFVSHEYKGVFKFTIDNLLTKASKVEKFNAPSKGKNASLVKFNDQIYYAYKEGVFIWNAKENKFQKNDVLSAIFVNDEYVTGKMVVDKSNKLWFFTKNYIHNFSSEKLSADLKKNSLPIPYSLTKSMTGYENILQFYDNNYLIGTTDGYYVLNNDNFTFSNHKVTLFSISKNSINGKPTQVSLNENGIFEHDENNLSFNFSVPEYDKYINAEYQYKLDGIHNDWTDWSFNSSVIFDNLPAGNYKFSVRAKVENSLSENIATYSFVIKKPWYANTFAVIFYFILFIVLAIYIHKLYSKYHEKIHQRIITENNILLELKELENKQKIMKIQNEQLSLDVDKMNKELAKSNLNLVKKTELLNIIKEDLKNSTDTSSSRSIKNIISTINKNVKDEESWNIFIEAFDNADNNFLKKVKEKHPSLTPNDLRLCAYLRLNLSSKEIAPLLKISVRSIEIKRYRLRKKMNLTHEEDLVEYLLSF